MPNQTRDTHDPNYPSEYILGRVVFFGREFSVTPDVLIPRLETESLVRRARLCIRARHITTVVDVGTGSGIIGTSCADMVEQVILLDISPSALEIAESNFRTHFREVSLRTICTDLITDIGLLDMEHTLFLANLPYIKADDWHLMSADTYFEPECALFGGENTGFEMTLRYLEMLDTYPRFTTIIEFGFDQTELVLSYMKQYGWQYEFFADHAGIERFCIISK